MKNVPLVLIIAAIAAITSCRTAQDPDTAQLNQLSASVLNTCKGHSKVVEQKLTSYGVQVFPISKGMVDAICLLEVKFPNPESYVNYINEAMASEHAINKFIVTDGSTDFNYDLLLSIATEHQSCNFLKGQSNYNKWREDSQRLNFKNALPANTTDLGIRSNESYFYVQNPFDSTGSIRLKWTNAINAEFINFQDLKTFKSKFIDTLNAQNLPLTVLKLKDSNTCIPYVLDFNKYNKVARASVGT
jgi:hypothetical protein